MTFRIALDLDGVSYKWDKTARYMLRRRIAEHGHTVDPRLFGESQSWDDIKDTVHSEDWEWLWKSAVGLGLFRYGHVVSGAIEGAQELTKLGEVIIVTSRPIAAVKDTNAWLTLMFDRVDYAGVRILSHGERKSDVRPRPDIFIDDGPHNLEDIVLNTDPATRCVLFDAPWNQDVSPNLLSEPEAWKWSRAYGWPDVVTRVRQAKEGMW